MRRASFGCGSGLLALLWLGPLPSLAQGSFTAHMTLHMGVVAVAAPLIAFGIAGSAADPVRRAPSLFPPVPLSFLELFAVWAWHAPALHHLARRSVAGFALEQGTFLVTGLLVWLSACGGSGPPRAGRRAAGVVALLLTSMHMTLLGALLALAPRPLYAHHAAGDLADQHLGGAVMLAIGGASYLAGGVWLTAGLLRRAAPGVEAR